MAFHVALMLTVLVGMAGLGTEMTFLLYKHRRMQAVADSAAFSAAVALSAGHPTPLVEARAIAAQMGFVHGAGGVTVTVNNPPAVSSSFAGNRRAVEVIVSEPQALSLVSLFPVSLREVSARAVAMTGGGAGACAVALRPSGTGMAVSGGATIDLDNCGLTINSSARSTALTVSGGAEITAAGGTISIVGGYTLSGGASVTPSPRVGASAAEDPYADETVPEPGTCVRTPDNPGGDQLKLSSGENRTVSPGAYCGGITLSGRARLSLLPGVYILKNGGLSLAGGSTFMGDGVTIVLTGDTADQVGSVRMSGGAYVDVSAPMTGATAGLAFFQDRKAWSGSNSFTGGATQAITGAIYFPKQTINYSGGTAINATCVQIVAYGVNFSGGSTLKLDCAGTPVKSIGGGSVQLVE